MVTFLRFYHYYNLGIARVAVVKREGSIFNIVKIGLNWVLTISRREYCRPLRAAGS